MAIRLFFEYKNTVVQLPVNPEQLKVVSSGDNKTTNLIALGEINQIHDMKLKTCSIESFLPANENGPYVLTKGKFEPPKFYIDLFNRIRQDKKPCRFLVSDTTINMLVSIEGFEYWLEGGDEDTHFTLSLKEYRNYSTKTVTTKSANTLGQQVVLVTQPARQPTGFAVGDMVTVTGKYFYTSAGAEPFGTFNNFKGKINIIKRGAAYPYHITTTSGGFRGWVKENQITYS